MATKIVKMTPALRAAIRAEYVTTRAYRVPSKHYKIGRQATRMAVKTFRSPGRFEREFAAALASGV